MGDGRSAIADRDVDPRACATAGGPTRLLKDVLRDVVFGEVHAANGFEKGLAHLRKGATIAGLGWNLPTAFLQPLGLTQSMVRIGPRWVARGLSRWLRKAASMERTVEWITERSAFMRHRGLTQEREINEIRNQVGINTGKLASWIDEGLRGTIGYIKALPIDISSRKRRTSSCASRRSDLSRVMPSATPVERHPLAW
jgi:hypothetical protein